MKSDALEHENLILRAEVAMLTTRKTPTLDSQRYHDHESLNTLYPDIATQKQFNRSEASILLIHENERLSLLIREEKEQYAKLHRAHIKLKERCKSFKDENTRWESFHAKLKKDSTKGKIIRREEQWDKEDSVKGNSETPSISFSSSSSQSKPLASGSSYLTPTILTGTPITSSTSTGGLDSTERLPSIVPYQCIHQESDVNSRPPCRGLRQGSPGAARGNSSETCDESHGQDCLTPTSIMRHNDTIAVLEHPVDDESDVPIVVAEHSLKRKRRRASNVPKVAVYKDTKFGLESDLRSIRVKSEQCSSSPLVATQLSIVDHVQDSLDLDETRYRIFTPRKKRQSANKLNSSPINILSRTSQRANVELAHIANPAINKSTALGSSANLSKGINTLPRNRIERQSIYNQTAHDKQSRLKIERSESSQSETMDSAQCEHSTRVEKAHSEPADATRSQYPPTTSLEGQVLDRAVLQPITPNTRILPQTYNSKTFLKSRTDKKQQGRSGLMIRYMAEDGEYATPKRPLELSHSTTALDMPKSPRDVHMHNRLDDLLKEPSPGKPPLRSTKKSQEISKDTSSKLQNALLTSRTLKLPEQCPDKLLTEHEPLRARPSTNLSLDNFKINPDWNQGYDFAFDEVIRKHEQRKCMPNCTKLGCCGDQFRKIVEIGGLPAPLQPKSNLWTLSSSLPPNDDDTDNHKGKNEEENSLLDEYLPITKPHFSRLPESTKQTLLIEAQAKYLANQHGRHKQHFFERASTPPGFWRTDMPTTQEALADRELALKAERRKVEERYGEAMRGDGKGRWKFRDE